MGISCVGNGFDGVRFCGWGLFGVWTKCVREGRDGVCLLPLGTFFLLGCGVFPAVLHPRRVVSFIRRVRGVKGYPYIGVLRIGVWGFLFSLFLLMLWGFPIAFVVYFLSRLYGYLCICGIVVVWVFWYTGCVGVFIRLGYVDEWFCFSWWGWFGSA